MTEKNSYYKFLSGFQTKETASFGKLNLHFSLFIKPIGFRYNLCVYSEFYRTLYT